MSKEIVRAIAAAEGDAERRERLRVYRDALAVLIFELQRELQGMDMGQQPSGKWTSAVLGTVKKYVATKESGNEH
jgi:hypothetical protein